MRKVELEVLNGFRSRVFFKLSSISSMSKAKAQGLHV